MGRSRDTSVSPLLVVAAIGIGLWLVAPACSNSPAGVAAEETAVDRPADYNALFPLDYPAHFAFRMWKDFGHKERDEDRDYYFALLWERNADNSGEYHLTAVVKRAVESIRFPSETRPELGEIRVLTWTLNELNCPPIREVQRRLPDVPIPTPSYDPGSRNVYIHPRVYQFYLSTPDGDTTFNIKGEHPSIDWAEDTRARVEECLK